MKEYTVEIVIDENGEMHAETKGMQGKICAGELDGVLAGVDAGAEKSRKISNTGDYFKQPRAKQTVRAGR